MQAILLFRTLINLTLTGQKKQNVCEKQWSQYKGRCYDKKLKNKGPSNKNFGQAIKGQKGKMPL